MPSRFLATDEPILEDALLLLAIAGGLLELASSVRLLVALFGDG